MDDQVECPQNLYPTYQDSIVCKHGHQFRNDEDGCFLLHSSSKFYTETAETVLRMKVYGRKSAGDCGCIQQPSGHCFMGYSIGNGKFIDYGWLLLAFTKFTKGHPINGQYEARREFFSNIKVHTSLSLSDFNKAVLGFGSNLEFQKSDFTCEKCSNGSDTPAYIILDGKCIAPRANQTNHLRELDQPETDNSTLPESTKFNDRCFLSEAKERKFVRELITEIITPQEFIQKVFKTPNGNLIKNLVTRLIQDFNGEIPEHYQKLLENLSKISPVCGFLQPTGPEALDLLLSFCDQTIDLRTVDNIARSRKLRAEIPALWPLLCKILNLEKARWLPDDLSLVVKALIRVRNQTFTSAKKRYSHNYTPYPANLGEHPLMFYPNWPIIR